MSSGTAVITPRWLYVLAAATPAAFGNAAICDETLEQLDPSRIAAGDVVGIGIHTGNAFRGYQVGKIARERGAWVVFGGIHATLYPEEALDFGAAHCAVKGDGDVVWSQVLRDCVTGCPKRIYDGGRVEPGQFLPARWDLLSENRYCGHPFKRSEDVRSIARSVRYGAPMVSVEDNALLTLSFKRLCSYAAKDSVL